MDRQDIDSLGLTRASLHILRSMEITYVEDAVAFAEQTISDLWQGREFPVQMCVDTVKELVGNPNRKERRANGLYEKSAKFQEFKVRTLKRIDDLVLEIMEKTDMHMQQVLLIGGNGTVNPSFVRKARTLGLDIQWEWGTAERPLSIGDFQLPRECEGVIVLNTVTSHGQAEVAIDAARSAQIPWASVSHKWSHALGQLIKNFNVEEPEMKGPVVTIKPVNSMIDDFRQHNTIKVTETVATTVEERYLSSPEIAKQVGCHFLKIVSLCDRHGIQHDSSESDGGTINRTRRRNLYGEKTVARILQILADEGAQRAHALKMLGQTPVEPAVPAKRPPDISGFDKLFSRRFSYTTEPVTEAAQVETVTSARSGNKEAFAEAMYDKMYNDRTGLGKILIITATPVSPTLLAPQVETVTDDYQQLLLLVNRILSKEAGHQAELARARTESDEYRVLFMDSQDELARVRLDHQSLKDKLTMLLA